VVIRDVIILLFVSVAEHSLFILLLQKFGPLFTRWRLLQANRVVNNAVVSSASASWTHGLMGMDCAVFTTYTAVASRSCVALPWIKSL